MNGTPVSGNIFGATYISPYANTQGSIFGAYTGYGSDGYSTILQNITGILDQYNMTLFDVSRAVLSHKDVTNTSSPARKEENALGSIVDDYDKQLLSLTQQLQKLRLQGKRPDLSTWGNNRDDLVNKCALVLKTCQDYSQNPDFHNSTRGVDWHLRGPIEVLTGLSQELVECSKNFSQTSLYANAVGNWVTPY